MELSRFLLAGVPDLHLANFLHMITTMAESGSTEEQLELFVVNNQKLSQLPSEESQWCIVSMPSPQEDKDTPTTSSALSLNHPKATAKKIGNNSSWPPVNWKTAPGFECASRTKQFGTAQMRREGTEEVIECDGDWVIEEKISSTIASVILEGDALNDRSDSAIDGDPSDMNVGFNSQSDYGKNIAFSDTNAGSSAITRYGGLSSSSIERDGLSWGTITPQQVITGRTGEFVAFKYFSTKIGENFVRWVNEVNESGLPYDIVVEVPGKTKEYIEVKATSNARKNWFSITVREWQYAVEKGDSFSIAHVVLSEGKAAQLTTYRNPLKLCQSGHIQLAILSSKKNH